MSIKKRSNEFRTCAMVKSNLGQRESMTHFLTKMHDGTDATIKLIQLEKEPYIAHSSKTCLRRELG